MSDYTFDPKNFYDRFGARYDWFSVYEGRAKERAFHWLDCSPGLRLLNVGVGTGREHQQIHKAIGPFGIAIGLDVSQVMLNLTRQRSAQPVVCADALWLPFREASFDRLYCAYTLDLLPQSCLSIVISGFKRVLRPGGMLVLVCLTRGIDLPSRALVAAWDLAFKLSPAMCAGCRPIQVSDLVIENDFTLIQHEVIVQWAIPSEIVVATRAD
jgi:ubiquinone/menaquinone biosynthesis C-methylase UbiE